MTRHFFRGVLLVLILSWIIGCVPEVYVPVPPPAARVEVRSATPFAEAVWIDGYWAHHYGNWVWVPGHWEGRPWPAAVWVPGHWRETPRGWQWVPGHWRRP